ncbi:hypothetical protein EGK26_00010 [Klebsiella pneumoniae]|nr:hypothetical protein EGK26_00010 [Klebsiella pneumoniae]RSA06899.1 hypothetical protein EGK07_16100 [Klebsiella pneumoniae]
MPDRFQDWPVHWKFSHKKWLKDLSEVAKLLLEREASFFNQIFDQSVGSRQRFWLADLLPLD